MVNRSEIVGRPLAALLANDGAKVYSIDITCVQRYHRGAGIKLRKHEVEETDLKLKDVAPLSDIIITGVPSADYKFPSELIRDGAICINFSSEKNFDTDAVKEHAAIYVPAIGKVTVAMLLRNLYDVLRTGLTIGFGCIATNKLLIRLQENMPLCQIKRVLWIVGLAEKHAKTCGTVPSIRVKYRAIPELITNSLTLFQKNGEYALCRSGQTNINLLIMS